MSDTSPVILITGASTGIGAATARMLAGEGWRLVLAARSIDKLDELASELGGPDHAVAVECDVTEWADQQAAVTVALEHFGRLDAAWANAGFGAQRSFLADSVGEWRSMVLTNVYGAALTIRASLPGTEGIEGTPAPHGLGRRAAQHPRLAVLRDEARGPRDGRVRPARARRNRRARHGDRAREWWIRRSSRRCRSTRRSRPNDVARAVLFALSQPPHVDVNEILVRPTAQPM